MSRVGNAPIPIPKGVEVKISGRTIDVTGPKGRLVRDVHADQARGEARGQGRRVMQRREFLRVSATAAGGMMLWVACGSKKAKRKDVEEATPAVAGEGAELNAWIRIDPDDTVTFRVSDAEMGQGILTAVS